MLRAGRLILLLTGALVLGTGTQVPAQISEPADNSVTAPASQSEPTPPASQDAPANTQSPPAQQQTPPPGGVGQQPPPQPPTVSLEQILQSLPADAKGEVIDAQLTSLEGRPAYAIQILQADGRVLRLFYDAQTGAQIPR